MADRGGAAAKSTRSADRRGARRWLPPRRERRAAAFPRLLLPHSGGPGPHAPGGAYNYVANGLMIGGFGLVAWPAHWGNTGVMTFVVNQDGEIYEKDLGPTTAAVAKAMTRFDVDTTWQKVGAPARLPGRQTKTERTRMSSVTERPRYGSDRGLQHHSSSTHGVGSEWRH